MKYLNEYRYKYVKFYSRSTIEKKELNIKKNCNNTLPEMLESSSECGAEGLFGDPEEDFFQRKDLNGDFDLERSLSFFFPLALEAKTNHKTLTKDN